LQACMETCGLSQQQIDALVQEGYILMEDFAMNRYQDISEMAKRVQALPVNRGGVRFGQVHIMKMKAFLFWLKDRQRRGLPLNLDDDGFNDPQLDKAVQDYRAEVEQKEADDTTAKVPDKFSPHTLRGWNTFNRELEAYLSNIRGLSGVPLLYVIRKDPDPNAPLPTDPKQILIAQAPHTGPTYIADRQKVYGVIRDAVSGSDGWTWIRDIKNEDGREAMIHLRAHYDGAGSKTRRVQEAKDRLKTCHYRSELHFTFDKYVTMLKDCFATLEEDERPVTERDKIDYLLDGIQCSQLSSAISNISMNPALRDTFESAANILQKEVHQIFPFANKRGKRDVAQVSAGNDAEDNEPRAVRQAKRQSWIRGRSSQGRGRGRANVNMNGGRGQEEKVIINGVDVTDVNRTFTQQEWSKLRGHYDYINRRRGRHDRTGRGGFRAPGRDGGRGRGRDGETIPARHIQALQQANTILSEITASIQQQEEQEQTQSNTAGNSFGVASYGGRQGRGINQGGPRTMSKVTTNSRRLLGASRTHTNRGPQIVEVSCEIDSHADTCCLGANFRPIYFTGKVCDVSPFLDTMAPQADIEICTGATAYDDDEGNTKILIINEALWMGHQMSHSLINPYQLRAIGVQLNDDPTAHDRFFSIRHDLVNIPFKM